MSYLDHLFRNMPPVTKNLIIVNLLIFLAMWIFPSGSRTLDHYGALHFFISPDFNPAQLFTYMFIHGGFTHVFFNMFSLFMFGPQIEYSLGSKRFLFYYISCGIGAALIQEGVYAIMLQKYTGMFTTQEFNEIIINGAKAIQRGMNFADPTLANINEIVNGPMVGASGAIYGVLLAFGMLFPERIIYLMIPPMPIKAKWMIIGFVAIELILGIRSTNIASTDNIAHFCHLGGMLVGFLIILFWKKKGTFNGYY